VGIKKKERERAYVRKILCTITAYVNLQIIKNQRKVKITKIIRKSRRRNLIQRQSKSREEEEDGR